MTGNTTSDSVASLNWSRRQRAMKVATERPTGQMRQNTGNPKAAVVSTVAPSTQLRESLAPSRSAGVGFVGPSAP